MSCLNLRTGQIEAEFHSYVRPDINQELSDFCTEFTGIEQVGPPPQKKTFFS